LGIGSRACGGNIVRLSHEPRAIRRAPFSGVECADFDGLEAQRVADDFQSRDAIAGEGEAENAEEAAARGDDEADRTVDHGDAGEASALRGLDGLFCPSLGAVNVGGNSGRCGDGVGVGGERWIEHFDELDGIAEAQGGEEAVDEGTLMGEFVIVESGNTANAAASAAGQLTGRFGGTAGDAGDFVEGKVEEIVEDEANAFGGIEAVKNDERGVADRVREKRFSFGVGGVVWLRWRLLVFERVFAAGFARAQHVEADAGGDGGEPAAEVVDVVGFCTAQAQPAFLDRVVGLTERTEHAISHAAQARAVLLEVFGEPVALSHWSLPFAFIHHGVDARQSLVVTEARPDL
jgi:hypothetical protein